MKKRSSFLLLVILSLLLSGFTLRPPAVDSMEKTFTFRVTTAIQSNGSGNVKVEAILSVDLVAFLDSGPTRFSGEEFCSTTESSQSLFKYALTTENNGVQCTAVVSFDDLQELENIMEDEGLGVSIQQLEIRSGRLYYNVKINTSGTQSSPYYTFHNYWALILPGTPGENNADTVDGNTLTWDLSNSSGWTSMTVESSIGGGGFLGMDSSTLAIVAFLMISCCCCVILLLAAGVVVFLMLRKQKQPAQEEHSPDTINLAS
jgi:hypothetical protein